MCLLIRNEGRGDSPGVLAEEKDYFLIFWLLNLRKQCSAGISYLTIAEDRHPDYFSTNPGLFEGKYPMKKIEFHQFVRRSNKPLKSEEALPCLGGNTDVSELLITPVGQSVALRAQNRAVGGCGGSRDGPQHPHVPVRPGPGCWSVWLGFFRRSPEQGRSDGGCSTASLYRRSPMLKCCMVHGGETPLSVLPSLLLPDAGGMEKFIQLEYNLLTGLPCLQPAWCLPVLPGDPQPVVPGGSLPVQRFPLSVSPRAGVRNRSSAHVQEGFAAD